MRIPKAEWVQALKALCGAEADLRYNETVGRWEFVLPEADGSCRSQFWSWFKDPRTGQPLSPDPVSGLLPFRDLDDGAMREALRNLEETFIGNPWDGAKDQRTMIRRRMQYNADLRQQRYREAGWLFADMVAERGRRLRGHPLIHVPVTIGGAKES